MYLWDYLKTTEKKIILYGIGNGAEKIFDLCDIYGISIAGIFASDDHQKEKTFHGLNVVSFEKIKESFDDFIILLAFGTEREDVYNNILKIKNENEMYAPDLPISGGPHIDEKYIKDNKDKIGRSRELFFDDTSKRVFDNIIEYKLSGKIDYLLEAETRLEEKNDILKLSSFEHFLDIGAYTGDTIQEFLELTNGKYDRITALEANKKNFEKLKDNTKELKNINLINKASWKNEGELLFCGKNGRNFSILTDIPGKKKSIKKIECISIDALDIKPTFVKMDVEGAENETIIGMKNIICNTHPKLLISAYHRTDDFIEIPLLINSICPSYRFYLRHLKALPCWELMIYCIYDEN